MVYFLIIFIIYSMKLFYIYLICFIASIATLIGNFFLLFPRKYERLIIGFSMGLSFGVMFCISILELIPEALLLGFYSLSKFGLFVLAFIFLFIGLAIVKLFDISIKEKGSLYKIGIMSSLSLFLHNVPEGVICALSMVSNFSLGIKMTLMILIHNIPEGICISLPIYYATGKKRKALFYTFFSSLGEFIGAFMTLSLVHGAISDPILFMLLLITAGIMITLSIFKLFPLGFNHSKKSLFLGIGVGFIIVLITL